MELPVSIESEVDEYDNVCANCQLEWISYGRAGDVCPNCGNKFILSGELK